MNKKIILLIILLLSIFMIGAVSASSNDSVASSSKVTNSISHNSDTDNLDISNIKNSEVKDTNNVLKKDNSKKVVSKNNNHTKSETTISSETEPYKDYYDNDYDDYDDYDDYNDYNNYDDYDDYDNYNDYDEYTYGYDYAYEPVYNAYIKSKTVHYGVNNSINFGWKGNFEGYFKVYKGNKQVYSYYLENYNGKYTYNPNGLNVGKYTAKLVSDGETIAKGKIVVKKAPSKISVKSFKTYPKTKFTCYAYVFNKKDNTYLGDEGYVKFKIKGKTYKAKVKNGEAKIKFTVPRKTGKYICTAQYIGTKNIKNSAKIKFKMVVKKRPKNKIVTYKDWCHGDAPKHTHKATWTKKYYSTEYLGNVYKNGHLYKKYVKRYEFTCNCKKDKYHREWLRYSGSKHYNYYTLSIGKHPKYIYKRIY